MTEGERLDVLAGIEGEREFVYIEALIDSIAADEAQAELRVALEGEEASLETIDVDGGWAARGEAEEWPAPLSEAERAAEADLAAATSGPLYTGTGDPDEYSDDIED